MYHGTMEVVPGPMTPITQYYNGQYQEPESQVLITYSKCMSLEKYKHLMKDCCSSLMLLMTVTLENLLSRRQKKYFFNSGRRYVNK